jgi:glycosyltransferase involved in cell wall biosynthesis
VTTLVRVRGSLARSRPAPRPRVAILGTRGYPSYYGGFETLVRKLAPYLAEQGWDVAVYSRAGATRPNDPRRHPGVRSINTPGRDTQSASTLSFGLSAVLHAMFRPPDVALIMNVANGYWLPLLKARRIPTVLNADGIEWEREKWGRLAKAVFRGGARMAARWADVLVYDAEAIKSHYEKIFGRSGVVIAYGGDPFGDLPVPEGLEHRRYALMVARFVPENTVPEFLDAAAELSESADVVLVGSSGYGGPLDQRAAALAASNPRIHWLGHISDDEKLFGLWEHAGAYFHGQSVGGTNPALVQAMACGAPIVARDTVYNREVLERAGVFVQPTSQAIRDGVLTMLSNPTTQAELSKAAQARAETCYTWHGICTSYDETLRHVLRRRRHVDGRGPTASSRKMRRRGAVPRPTAEEP